MKAIFKFPLYLGIFIFIFSTIISTVTVSQKRNIGRVEIGATNSIAKLYLRFVPPRIISVEMNSTVDVVGVDVGLKYNPSHIRILPSTLTSTSFITTGGVNDDVKGIYTFSAINENPLKAAVVATFQIDARSGYKGRSEIEFDNITSVNSIIGENSNGNILNETKGISFTLE